ncbi:MAG: ABC transporter permease [Opitutales bacterium]
MSKVFAIAFSEYRQFVYTKTFLFLLILSPLLMAVIVGATLMAEASRDLTDRRFVVVDRTGGEVLENLESLARTRNEEDIFTRIEDLPGTQQQARFIPVRPARAGISPRQVAGRNGEDALLVKLSEAVRRGEYAAFIIIEPWALDPVAVRQSEEPAYRYFAENLTYQPLPGWLEDALNQAVRSIRLTREGIDPEQVRRLTVAGDLDRFNLAELGPDGKVESAGEADPVVTLMVPFGAVMLLFFCANMSSPIMLNNVIEEKMQKIAEVLLAAVTPLQLMAGKLIGSIGASLTLGLVYLAPGLLFLGMRDVLDQVPVAVWIAFPFFLLLTLLALGAVWGAIGAACSEIKDTQNFAGIAVFLLILPIFFAPVILENPDTGFARVVSLVPPFYPFLMLLRLGIPPGPPAWEVAVGLLGCLVFTGLVLWAGARIFRRGLLASGKTPSLLGLIRWIREAD